MNGTLNLLFGIWSLGAPGTGPGIPAAYSIASADFTGEGRADVLVEDRENGDAFVLAGQGDRTFSTLPAFAWLPSENVAAGDVNGDGLIDVVGVVQTPYSAGSVEVALNEGNGVFGPLIRSFTTGYAGVDGAVVLGDVDNDGDLDLVVSAVVLGSKQDGVAVMLGDGDGHFASYRWYGAGVEDEDNGVAPLSLADVDGDGNLDLAVQEAGNNNTIGVMFGHGDGSFDAVGAAATVTGITEGNLLAVGDVTGDGLADVVVLAIVGDTGGVPNVEISVLENLGGRTFGPPQAIGDIGGWAQVTIADVDGDGHNDIVAVGGPGVVSVLRLACVKQP